MRLSPLSIVASATACASAPSSKPGIAFRPSTIAEQNSQRFVWGDIKLLDGDTFINVDAYSGETRLFAAFAVAGSTQVLRAGYVICYDRGDGTYRPQLMQVDFTEDEVVDKLKEYVEKCRGKNHSG